MSPPEELAESSAAAREAAAGPTLPSGRRSSSSSGDRLADPLIGQIVDGRLRIDGLLAVGGMGVVYRAHHLLLDQPMALKMIRPSLGDTPEARERFLREARTATAITHPRIVTIREVGEFHEQPYITMDLVEGRSLQDILDDGAPLPLDDTVRIGDEILEALEAAHARDIIHRDLKPGNVMIDEQGGVRVLDFGLAKFVGEATRQSSLTATGQIIGTLGYMAPEQFSGGHIDGRTDLYALSALLYEMLAGRLPYGNAVGPELLKKIVLEEPEPLEGPLAPLVMAGLAKDPDDRPDSATDYRVRLWRLARGVRLPNAGSPTAARAAAVRHTSRAARSWRVVAAAALISTAGLFAALEVGRESGADNPIDLALQDHASLTPHAPSKESTPDATPEAAPVERSGRTRRAEPEEPRPDARSATVDYSATATTVVLPSTPASTDTPRRETGGAASGDDAEDAARRKAVARSIAQVEDALERRDVRAARDALTKAAETAEEGEADRLEALSARLEVLTHALAAPARALRQKLVSTKAERRSLDAKIEAAHQALASLSGTSPARRRAAERVLLALRRTRDLGQSEVLVSSPLEATEREVAQAVASAEDEPSPHALKQVAALAQRLHELDSALAVIAADVRRAFEVHERGRSALHIAAQRKDRAALSRALEIGIDPNGLDNDGVAPLHVAAITGFAEGIDLLRTAGADDDVLPEYTDGDWTLRGVRSVHLAAWSGHADATVALLKSGIDADAEFSSLTDVAVFRLAPKQGRFLVGGTALHVASARGHGAVVRALLDGGANRDARSKSFFALAGPARSGEQIALWTLKNVHAAHVAAAVGAEACVTELLDEGVAVDVGDVNDETPLMQAAVFGHEATFRLLIARGASIHHRSKFGDLAIHAAAYGNAVGIVRRILASDPNQLEIRGRDKRVPLLDAALASGTDALEFLVAEGARLDATNKDGDGVVSHAAWYGRKKAIRLLAEAGADKHHPNKWGVRPIHTAAMHGRVGAIETLLSLGVSTNQKTAKGTAPDAWEGYTPFLMAVARSQTEAAQFLLDRGVSIRQTTTEGLAAIHVATLQDQPKGLEWLLDRGVPIERPWLSTNETYRGMTPLGIAAAWDKQAVLPVLLRRGANVQARFGGAGGTALHWAANRSSGGLENAQALLDAGTPVDIRTSGEHVNALMWTAEADRMDMARLLLRHGASPNVQSSKTGYRSLDIATSDPMRQLFRAHGGH